MILHGKFLYAVTAMIRKCDIVFEHQSVSNILYAMRGMSSDNPIVLELMSAFAVKIPGSHGDLDAREVGNAIYGLNRMTSEHLEIRYILKA